MPVEISRVEVGDVETFLRDHEREALKTLFNFSVVWHEQRHDFAARDGADVVGIATIRIAASLAHVEQVIVLPERRLAGAGRSLLDRAAEVANYYNCHKRSSRSKTRVRASIRAISRWFSIAFTARINRATGPFQVRA